MSPSASSAPTPARNKRYRGRLGPAAYARFLAYSRGYQTEIRNRRKAAGFCTKCGEVEVTKYVRCFKCRQYCNIHRYRKKVA